MFITLSVSNSELQITFRIYINGSLLCNSRSCSSTTDGERVLFSKEFEVPWNRDQREEIILTFIICPENKEPTEPVAVRTKLK
jgi:hypothetical protein